MQRTLRILHIINSLDPREGGTVECVRQVGSSVVASGHDVEVAACSDSPEDPWLGAFPLKVHPLGPGAGKYAYTPRLRAWLRSEGKRFDAWIINGLWQYQGFGASRVARDLGIPYFVYAHGMLDPWNRRATPLKYVKKLLYWLVAERETLEGAAALVFTSQQESVLAKRYFPVVRWRELVVGNGVAEPPPLSEGHEQRFRQFASIPEGTDVMLFLSRIHPKKGIDILLRAFASAPSVRGRCVLVIAGDGDRRYVESLQALGRQLGIDARVRWTGPLYGERKWEAFSAAKLFVLPSHQENFGIAVAEALAMKTPVCTTTAVNIHDVIERYRAGIVCRDNADGLAAAFARWSALGAGELDQMKANARTCFEQEFRIGSASNRLVDAIRAAVDSARTEGEVVH